MATGDSLDFASFCNFIQACSNIKPIKADPASAKARRENRKILDHFASFAAFARQRSSAHEDAGVHLFRLLFPDLDIRRRYGLKETLLLEQLYHVFDISRDGQAAQLLKRWNEPEVAVYESPATGCLGLQVQSILKSRRGDRQASRLTLAQVDILLNQLACHCQWSNLGPDRVSNPASRLAILQALYRPLNAYQSAVMTQIILKDLSPLLYPPPSTSTSVALRQYNASSYRRLDLYDALRGWHWALPQIFRFRNDLDQALRLSPRVDRTRSVEAQRQLERVCTAEVGSLVQIPKARKGTGFANTIAYYQSSNADSLWCETKYDGERMQIHVDAGHNIRIFSKSKRDSTEDRASTHPIIRAALGLPAPAHSNPLLRDRSVITPPAQQTCSSIILEAEMVAFNETRDCIDEFWRISQMKERDDKSGASVMIAESQLESDVSQMTNSTISPGVSPRKQAVKELHFQLVFFDVLLLDGRSLVQEPYDTRRDVLERTVRSIHGFSQLAKRSRVDLKLPSREAEHALKDIFDQCTEAREEGLLLKTGDSAYNDSRKACQWTKLKKDYIDGLGDSASFVVLGVGHDKERGRQLGVGPQTWTTFFMGLQTNRKAAKANPTLRSNFHVLFSVSWGLDRAQLDYINGYTARCAEPLALRDIQQPDLSFTFQLSNGLESKPSFVLRKPMVFEVYGGGWTRAANSDYYSLRFPRISNLHCHARPLSEAIDLQESERIAASAVHPDLPSPRGDADQLWRLRTPTFSPSIGQKRKRTSLTPPSSSKRFRALLDAPVSCAVEGHVTPNNSRTRHTLAPKSGTKQPHPSPRALEVIKEEPTAITTSRPPPPRKAEPFQLPGPPPKASSSPGHAWWCLMGAAATTSRNAAFAAPSRLSSVEAMCVAAGWQVPGVCPPSGRDLRRGYLFVDTSLFPHWRSQVGALLKKSRRLTRSKPILVFDVAALSEVESTAWSKKLRLAELG